MPFVPLDSFPRVSAEEQAARDAIAEQLVANEFQDDMPDSSRAALESEYRQRFGKEPSTTQRGFVPLAQQGFLPLDQETPSVLKTVLLENPATAIGEAALNLGSQAIALPVAGIAGLATEAGRALGFTDKSGADVVRQVGEKLTYEPRGEFGKAATDLATKPFQLLAEAGHAAGSKVLDATGSPASATAVDTAINALPMAIGPGIKGAKAVRERAVSPERVEPTAPPTVDNGFVALTDSVPDIPATTLVRQVVDSPALVQKKAADAAMEALPQARSVDEAIGQFEKAVDTPIEPAVQHVVDVPVELPPGRFSSLADESLARLTDVPEIKQEIAIEQQRRALLAEQVAGERGIEPAAVQESQPVAPPPPTLTIEPNQHGNLVIRGEPGALEIAEQGLRESFDGQTHALRKREADGSVSLVIGKRISTEQPDAIHAAVGDINDYFHRPRSDVQPMQPGANYVPLVDHVREAVSETASTSDLSAPIRREQIIKRLASDLGTTVYEGRIKGEKMLGFFRPRVEEVRTKRANDIEVTAHEIAHMLDARVPEIQRAYLNDKALREDLRGVSYDRRNVKEGWAEAIRLWMTQPETLAAKAPIAHAWIENFAKSHEYGPALRQAQQSMTAWFGQDALNRARSKIGTDKPLSEYFDGFWNKFRQSTVDDLHGIYRMERDMTGRINPNGPYESARLSRASASIADGAVRFGYPVKQADGSFKFAGKGLEELLQPVSKNIDDALLYFVGRSANELMSQGREHLFTKGEIQAMLKLRTPERDQAFKDYQAWNKGILDFAEAQGIINPEARRLWQRTQYLPFHRVDQPGGIKGKPGDWAGIQQLTGGTTNIKDILGNMIGNAAMLVDKAVKNEARKKVANLALRPGGGKFMVKIEPGERMVRISGDQVLDALFKKYGIAMDGDAPAFFEFLIKGQPPAGSNVVAVMQGGKPIWFEVGDPILYRALKALDRPVMNEVVKWLGLPKRIGQATITATPDFWMANMARDTLMGAVMSRAGFRPILDSLKGMTSRMAMDQTYRDYLANGGGLSSIFLDEHHLRSKLEKYYRDQKIDYRTVLDTPDKLLTLVESLGDAFEMSTRLGEYKRAIERGENPRHAAYLGRDVSTDFAMKGDSKALGFMYDTVMFLRPAVVSWDRLYRGLAHDPNKGAIAAKAGLMALFSAGLYLLNRDDPRYADLPDWDRDSHWHFFVGDQHFRWPKIWEIGALSSAAERSVEKIIAADPQGLGKDFARILAATFNLNLMPQILAPLYEQGANKNSFTKAPIETPGMENVQPFLRAKPGTSETMRALGMATRDLPEGLQVNPVRAEALLRGYFNTWALYGLMLSDKALFGDTLPEKRTDELPVVRRFYSQEPPKHTKYEEVFYDLLGEAKRLRGTLRELDDMGLRTLADEKEQSPLATEAKPLERAAKNLAAINNEMQLIRRDKSLTPDEKRQKLDALTVERNALMKAAVLDSQQARKGQ